MDKVESFLLDVKRGCNVVTNVIDALIKSAKENEEQYKKEQEEKRRSTSQPKTFTVLKKEEQEWLVYY